TVVEFIDFKCVNSKAEASILRQMMQKYGNKVKLIIRNFPVESTYPGSSQLSVLALCSYAQGNYWPMHDWLFENQANLANTLGDEDLDGIAQNFGMDAEKLKNCMKSNDVKVAVNKDYADGYRFGIGGTPTFFVNGEKVEGAIPYNAWEMFFQNLK
ncbi:MAG: DsbA oxidoreductase, partial [uncultured bacterium]